VVFGLKKAKMATLGLDRTGTGLKKVLAGSGLDRTKKIFVVLM